MLTARLAADGDGRVRLTATGTVDARNAVAVVETGARLGEPAFADAIRHAHREALGRLDPSSGALVQVVAVYGADGDGRQVGRVVVAIHHLGVDVVSWPVLIEDFATAYAAVAAGEAPRLRSRGRRCGLGRRRWLSVLPRAPTRSSTGWRAHRSRRLIWVGA